MRDVGPAAEVQPSTADGRTGGSRPLIIALVAREQGITGVHTHVRELRRHLDDHGETSDLLTPHSWSATGARLGWRRLVLLPLFGVRVVLERTWGPANVWWYRTSHELFLRRALRLRLAEEDDCVVYAQCPVAARAALAARSGPEQRVVLAVHFRTSQADEWANKGQIPRGGRVYRWIRRTEHEVVPTVDGLVFVSTWAQEAVRSWMPEVDRVPRAVIGNFVHDPGRVEEPADAPRTDVRPRSERLLATGDLVSVGNLEAVKNHRYLLRVLAAARVAGHTYTLDVYGEGAERAKLVALAEELGIADQVRLRGFCSDVQDRLPGYRTYVHASYSESSSLAIMEAMAVGLPVVSGREGALAELFDDGVEGRFWPLDDPQEAARILIDMLEDPARLATAGRAARRRFLKDYDAEAVAPRLLQFLRAPGAVGRGGC